LLVLPLLVLLPLLLMLLVLLVLLVLIRPDGRAKPTHPNILPSAKNQPSRSTSAPPSPSSSSPSFTVYSCSQHAGRPVVKRRRRGRRAGGVLIRAKEGGGLAQGHGWDRISVLKVVVSLVVVAAAVVLKNGVRVRDARRLAWDRGVKGRAAKGEDCLPRWVEGRRKGQSEQKGVWETCCCSSVVVCGVGFSVRVVGAKQREARQKAANRSKEK